MEWLTRRAVDRREHGQSNGVFSGGTNSQCSGQKGTVEGVLVEGVTRSAVDRGDS